MINGNCKQSATRYSRIFNCRFTGGAEEADAPNPAKFFRLISYKNFWLRG